MIFSTQPSTWKDLQDRVCQILKQCGYYAESPKEIYTARSSKLEVDVYAEDTSIHHQVIICECKCWNSNIPQSVVHAFRAQLDDIGANLGLLISKNGFQPGAVDAARFTNIKLLSWKEFEALYQPLWYKKYFLLRVDEICDAFIEYNEPINSRIFKKADALAIDRRQRFIDLRGKHIAMCTLCSSLSATYYRAAMQHNFNSVQQLSLPLSKNIEYKQLANYLDNRIRSTEFYLEFLDLIEEYVTNALAEFDDVFGERA
ncbi:MAG: restriction endonuclease [Acidaminococcaceae bacterium]